MRVSSLLIIVINLIFTVSLSAQISKTIEEYGAKGDGITDDKNAIQTAFDALKRYGGEIKFTSGKTYIIGGGLFMNYFSKDKYYLVTTTGKKKATIKIKDRVPITYGYWGLFLASSQNITIKNLRLDGNRDTRNPDHEVADVYLLEIRNKCDGLRLYDMELVNSVMDNIYISVSGDETDTTKWTTDFEMYNCLLENGYRNNMSIIRGMNYKIIGCEFNNAHGHDPESGIDFEPNRVGSTVGYKNILVEGCIFKNNKRYGIMLTHKRTNSGYCTIRNCYFENNGLQFASHHNIAIKNIFRKQTRPSDYGGPVDGIINIIDGDASNNKVSNNFFYDNKQPATPSRNLIALLRGANANNNIYYNYSFNNSAKSIVYNYSSNSQNIYDNYKLKNREIAYWNMDADSIHGNIISDISDFSNEGFLNDNPEIVSGKLGDAIDFLGNNFMEVAVSENLNIETNVTFAAWVKWNGNNNDSIQTIIGRGDNWQFFITGNGELGFNASQKDENSYLGGELKISETIDKKKWTFVTFTYTSRESKLFINGEEKVQKFVYGNLDTSCNKIYIGSKNNTTSLFNGSIDEVKIYNYPFTNNEVKKLYDSYESVEVEKNKKQVPFKYSLKQNYPNPFNPSTVITFTIPKAGNTKIKVYNLLGQIVTELLNENINIGVHNIKFDGSSLSSGIYFYKLESGKYTDIKKMMLAK